MAGWGAFAEAAPELAAFGRERLAGRVAYLATVRPDGGPRVHPVTPILSDERLFLFMEPTSPKGRDIERDGRYTLHCGVEDDSGGGGEFYVRGRAARTDDPALRREAAAASSYDPAERYILFVLDVDFAFMNVYGEDGQPNVRRWRG
jgi:hypothetical protein